MIDRRLKFLLNALSSVLLVWIAYVIYGSFTSSGVWKMVVGWLASGSGRHSPAGAFAVSALLGIVPLASLGWVLWRVFLQRKDS